MTVPEARRAVEAATEEGARHTPVAPSMGREIGQSIYLMALMAVMLTAYVGLGLLAVRIFG
jgi:hypothetical protein